MVIRRSHWLVLGGSLSLLVPVQGQQAQQADNNKHEPSCIVTSPGKVEVSVQAQQAQTDEYNKYLPACIVMVPDVASQLKIRDVAPKYPKDAIAKRLEGVVRLQATIDRKGRVAKLKVAQGDPILAKAAVKAVKQWRYRPYLLNGEPAELETTIEVLFHL